MILAIVQARMGSARLPGKVMKKVLGKPLIEHLLKRLKKSEKINKIVVATSREKNNDKLCQYLKNFGLDVYRGKEEDVLDRYYQVALQYRPDIVVRITGDCPLIDYKVVDKVINYYEEHEFDYVSNVIPPTYPDGLDTEVFSFSVLEDAWRNAMLKSEREHVTPYIVNSGRFKIGNVEAETDFSEKRWTLDRKEDYVFLEKLYKHLYRENSYFGMKEILDFLKKHPELEKINSGITRNEGYLMSVKEK